jgi:hypothetical protein
MTTYPARFLVLLAGICLAAQADTVLAQQNPPQKSVYDQYEPSKVRRTRLQECLRDEEPAGAYCVKLCQKGYQPVPKSAPPRCRSIEPLPPGQIAGPIRKETGTQAKLPGQKPLPPGSGHRD